MKTPPSSAETPFTAAPFLPEKISYRSLAKAVQECHGCPLYQQATQAVFGEGPADAKLVLLGEVPGDQEDRQGHPFVGPAGKLLDDGLALVGLKRDDVYITNAV